MNSAKPIDQDIFGRGLLQVEKTIAYLDKHQDAVDNDIFFEVNTSGTDRGIYVRDWESCHKKQLVYNVTVQPKFQESVKNETKVQFETHTSLICSEPWIKAPAFVQLNNGGSCQIWLF